MKPVTQHTSFCVFSFLATALLLTTLLACTPFADDSNAAPTSVLDLSTEPSADQIASLMSPLTPEPTATPAGKIYAWNNLAEIESADVSIRIARLVIADQLARPKEVPADPVFQEMPVVAQIIFSVKNSGDEILLVFPSHASVETGPESLFLIDFPFFVGDVVTGGIQPGETKIGGYWFGFRQTQIEEIQQLLLSFEAPVIFGDELAEPQGPGYNFDLDLSQRRNDPVPDDLKDLKSFP